MDRCYRVHDGVRKGCEMVEIGRGSKSIFGERAKVSGLMGRSGPTGPATCALESPEVVRGGRGGEKSKDCYEKVVHRVLYVCFVSREEAVSPSR